MFILITIAFLYIYKNFKKKLIDGRHATNCRKSIFIRIPPFTVTVVLVDSSPTNTH